MRVHIAAAAFAALLLLCAVAGMAAAGGYSITDLAGGHTSEALAINDAGQIVGYSDGHACLWQNGTITDRGTLPGDIVSWACGINDAGQIVGRSEDASGYYHACLWQNGAVTDLGTLPGYDSSGAYAINDAGQIVGSSYTAAGGPEHACLWQNGTVTDLGTLPPFVDSYALAINDAGQIVGCSDEHACLWQNGAITGLATLPGGIYGGASAINAAGQIVGWSDWSEDAGHYEHACLWQNGAITDLGTLPGDSDSAASGINDAGQIVVESGNFFDGGYYGHACFWQNGAITDLGTLPGDSWSWASGINDAGQIVGWSEDAGYNEHACLWQPAAGITKSADVRAAASGANVTFTITAQGGAMGAEAAIVTDQLDPQLTFVSATGGGSYDAGRRTVTWTLGDLAAGSSASVTVTTQIAPTAELGTQITNQAVLSCSNLSSVSAEASVFVATTEPQYPISFWDASLSSVVGADVTGGSLDLFGVGVDAATIGAEGEHKTGGRYELQHADVGDVLTIRRINGGGLTVSGDLLSVDAGVVQGSAAAAEVGLSVLEERAYRFDRAFGDATSDAEVLKQDQVITDLTLANLAEMCEQDPLTRAVTGFLDNLGMDCLAAGYRYQTKTDIAGEASASLAELGLGTSNVEVTGSLSNGALGAGRGFEWYHQETPAPTPDEPYAREYGSTVAFSGETPFSALGQSCGTGSLSVGLDKDTSSTVTNYFMEAGAQNTITTSLITEDAAEQTIRFDIPPSSLSSVLPSLSGGLFADLTSSSKSLVAKGPADRAAQFDQLHDALLTASSSQSDPVAGYGRSSSTQRAYSVGFTIDPGLSLGLGAHLKLGLSASALVGQEAKTEDGQIQGGSQQPTVIYTNPQPPAYSGASGFGDMMAGIGKSALVGSWSQLWDSLPHVWDTIQSGVDKILQAASPLGSEVPEGATQVLVHGASFTSSITASLYSTAADLGSMVFGGTGASPAGIVLPYRSRRLGQLQLRTAAMPTSSATLTLVGRVHVVTAADSTGAPIDSFPGGGMVFQSTATAQQLQGYSFPASALSSVRLYHFLPDTVSWVEVPSTQQSADAGVTVTGDLSEAGDYALGILNTGVTPTGACVVNMTPLSGQMCSGPTVHVEAIFNSPAGMNPTSAALQADGSEVPGATATLSGAGLYLDMAGDVTLAPGPHRAKVWASDLAGLPGFGTALFYVQRENTFPDVPPDFWAWRQVEATKLSGIVAGYPDGTYQPGTAVTRDQMAVYIARALAGGDAYVPSGPATADFADVPTTYWAYEYIEYAKSMNVVVGYPDGTYQPDTVVTRDQMAVYVSRAVVNPTGDAGLQGYTPPATPSFPDVLTSNWAYEYIEYAKAQGIVAGYPDGTYQPGVTVTRDQMAVYVARAFQLAM